LGKKRSSVVERGRRVLEEHEQRKMEAAKKFNPKALVSRELQTIYDPELGEIRFGQLTIADSLEIGRVKSDDERSLLVLYHMLRKAYPDLTLEDVKNFPVDVATRLMALITENLNLSVLTGKQLGSGLKQTSKRS